MTKDGQRASVVLVVALVAVAALVAVPSTPLVDGTSDEALMESIEDIMGSLDATERARLEDALLALTAHRLYDCDREAGNEALPGYRSLLNGLTAEEIIALTDRVAEGEHW